MLRALMWGRPNHPVDHYLELWSNFSGAVTFGMVAHGALVLYLRWRGASASFTYWFRLYAAGMLATTVLTWTRQDYFAYVEVWQMVRDGKDPWSVAPGGQFPLNAYGPLFGLLAFPAAWSILVPKVFFASVYLFLLASLLPDSRTAGSRLQFGLILVAVTTPWFWLEVVWYGHFDTLTAVLCIAAVALARRGLDAASGACVGLGFLLKLFPVLLLPFLGVWGRRLRPVLITSGVVTIVLGIGASVSVWGTSTFTPLRTNAARGSCFLSVSYYLRGPYSPFYSLTNRYDWDELSMFCFAFVGLLLFAAAWWYRFDVVTKATLVLLSPLVFYKAGLPQYHTNVAGLLLYYSLVWPGLPTRDRRLKTAILAYLGYLTAVNCVYVVTDFWVTRSRWSVLADVVGLPAFLIGIWLVYELVRVGHWRALTTGPRTPDGQAGDWPADGAAASNSLRRVLRRLCCQPSL